MLGCGEWQAAITGRGGSPTVTILPFASLSCSRIIDDSSTASVTINASQAHACCPELATIFPWEHELVLMRDSVTVWVGPVTSVAFTTSTITVNASDLFVWFDRRLVPPFDRANDLAILFDYIASVALAPDPSPNITVSVAPTGIAGRRAAGSLTRAGDLLRELSRTAIDFTFLGRGLFVGEYAAALTPLTLTTDSFGDDLTLRIDGSTAASEITVFGATDTIVGRVGTTTTQLGLVQLIESESSILDTTSAVAAASSRLESASAGSIEVNASLHSASDLVFSDLVPGARVSLRLELLCKSVALDMRLASVNVNVGDAGEQVGVRFIPQGAA